MRKPGRAFWITLGKVAVIVAILVTISRLDIINATTISRIFSDPTAGGGAILSLIVAIHLGALRWHLLLRIQGQSISLRRIWVITFTSYFVGTYMFGSVGTDALRLYYIGRESPRSVGQAYLSIAADRLVGLAGLVLVGAALFFVNFSEIVRHPEIRGLILLSALLGGGIILVAALVVKFDRFVSPFLPNLRAMHRIAAHMNLLADYYRGSLSLVALCLLISVAIHTLTLASLVILTRALFADSLLVSQLGLAGVMATLANQIPITPGGLAFGEGTFAYLCHLMDPVDVTSDYGSVIFLQRLVALIATVPGLFLYLAYRRIDPAGQKIFASRHNATANGPKS